MSVDSGHIDTLFLAATNGLEQILKMKTLPSIANKGDHSMPPLQNPRHERFAQELATGNSADAAYVAAADVEMERREIEHISKATAGLFEERTHVLICELRLLDM